MERTKCNRCGGDGVDPSIMDMDFCGHEWGIPMCERCEGSGKEPTPEELNERWIEQERMMDKCK